MNARNVVSGWLAELGGMIGTPLKLQEDGVCAIRFSGGKVCTIEVPETAGPVLVHAPLLSLAGQPSREAVYARALKLNLYGLGTGGCSIALEPDRDELVLWASRSVGALDADSFASLVGGVIKFAAGLSKQLQEADPGSPGPGSSPDVPAAAYGIRV